MRFAIFILILVRYTCVNTFGQVTVVKVDSLIASGNLVLAKGVCEKLLVKVMDDSGACSKETIKIASKLIGLKLLVDSPNQALKFAEVFKGCKLTSGFYNALGVVYSMKKDVDSSIFFRKKALKGSSGSFKASVYNNLGVLYASKGDADSSLYYYRLSLGYGKSQGDGLQVARLYNNIGKVFVMHSRLDSGMYYYRKSLIANQVDNFIKLEALISLSEINPSQGYILQADSLIRYLQGNIVRRADKLRLLRQSKRLFSIALNMYSRLYDKTRLDRYLEYLFYFSEREKGNVLLSQLKQDVLELKGVQKGLRSSEVLLQYFQVDKGLFCFVVKRNSRQLVKVTNVSQDSLRRAVEAFVAECNTLGLHDFMKLSPVLHGLLLGKVRGVMIGCEHVTIVPTLLLSNLPFEALMSKRQAMSMRGYQDADYLLKSFSVSYHISATLAILGTRLRYQQGFVGISHSLFENGLKPLPYGEVEVTTAGRFFKGKVFRNLSNSKGVLSGVDVNGLHIATHGYYDERNAESGLWLKSKGKDVVLTVSEVLKIKPRARLVILSGCSTSDGRIVDGEGIVNLPYAFAYSGSRFVLSSLWVLPDKTTAEFMSLFYQGLQVMSTPKALQRAKLDMINKTLPFFWTSFVLLGR